MNTKLETFTVNCNAINLFHNRIIHNSRTSFALQLSLPHSQNQFALHIKASKTHIPLTNSVQMPCKIQTVKNVINLNN